MIPDGVVVGARLHFKREKRPYRVTAVGKRFAIAWKPYPGSYMYTIVDFQTHVRGPDNMIFGPHYEYNTTKGASEGIAALESEDSELEVSRRRLCKLDLVKVSAP